MAFAWKSPKDIWKGEGIYFVTFAVTGRERLLGNLVRIMEDGSFAPARPDDQIDPRQLAGRWDAERFGKHTATVRLNALGFAVSNDLNNIGERHPGYEICGKQIMENHLHIVIWVHDDPSAESGHAKKRSIKQWAHGFRMGITQIAREMGVWPLSPVGGAPVAQGEGDEVRDTHFLNNGRGAEANGRMMETTGRGAEADEPAEDDTRGGGQLLEKAFIRTLSHRGQLQNMLKYTHNNPDNLLLMVDNPGFYTIRRNEEHAGLHFDCMGKARLLDYPERNVVALSRSLTPVQIEEEVQKALWRAECGAVTYCAAINEGEKKVTKAIREAGYPLVVMMLDGFPPEGTDAARFFHPGGAYHQACGEGLLYLMAPLAVNYDDPRLIARTEATLKAKDEAKGYAYKPLPHASKRWRMIAGNEMLRMMAEPSESLA